MVGKGGGNEGERLGVVGATKYEKTTIPALFINAMVNSSCKPNLVYCGVFKIE